MEERERSGDIFLLFFENAFQIARAGRRYGLGTDYENGTKVT